MSTTYLSRSISIESVCSDLSVDTEKPIISNRSLSPGRSGGYILRPRKDGTFVKRYLYDKPLYNDNAHGGIIIQVYDNDDGEQCLPLSFDEILYDNSNSFLTIEKLNIHNPINTGIYGYVVGSGREGINQYLFKSIHDYGNGNSREVFRR
jgi:hypothetical protein